MSGCKMNRPNLASASGLSVVLFLVLPLTITNVSAYDLPRSSPGFISTRGRSVRVVPIPRKQPTHWNRPARRPGRSGDCSNLANLAMHAKICGIPRRGCGMIWSAPQGKRCQRSTSGR
uniref:Putative secreted protein n=1 Tax=Ixodes ricinus TaxID=34613 RepID=A0A6B0UMA1_IXORI